MGVIKLHSIINLRPDMLEIIFSGVFVYVMCVRKLKNAAFSFFSSKIARQYSATFFCRFAVSSSHAI